MSLKSINPYNGKTIKSYKEYSTKKINLKIEQTHNAWILWKETSFKERGVLMKKLARVLRSKKEDLAKLMTLEMGKPYKARISEVEKCAWVCEYYAENAKGFLKDQEIKTDAAKSFVAFQPIGVVLAIMPWNFPFWQVFRFLAPGLMAGNCGLLKHASNVSGCALAIEKMVIAAGFPKHVFQTLLVSGKKVNPIIGNPLIKAVTITGSTAAGKAVAEKAGSVLKKCVLELGGSDPYVILADADLETAVEACVNSRMINNGQSCIAAKRFIVIKSIQKDFIKLFKEKMSAKVMGNPMDEKTELGPQARIDLRNELHEQVKNSIKKGAKCILGGAIPKCKGAFYPATILTNVKKGMPAYDDELFGPVASIILAKNEEEAIKIANDSVFGLGSAIFTKDIKKGEKIAKEQLQAGSAFVNEFVKSDPRLPFGGINQSGFGRELGTFGIYEFVNIKTVYVK
ncbi:MAG: NAD-dependent succinate-semialdehyde dehydrogenase [Bacteroidetes bacterium]|nr:NAD-dependent succinate-semialdehyde dehydrogenase [Bacteroidota bacterium]MBU1484993.1 NAD-dependent succinate-semialdehyde dehydrogenase [Bacteroidota bacterium]MBU2046447.1 NAD-dependent succinate-semialdehyde dehydrogenase [Bacteroidota bacterium]MBU2266978.1 NAD-dependent succinate-semialdehyde dehydrogenase [Bacteroidota bacterium]MBU2377474.1 NAD-dependent succinate-semialdehyde dehydrogenase [Bacteroidota bacterium]